MKIVTLPDPILRKKMAQVSIEEVMSGSLGELFSDMKKTMAKNNGVGLAANQIGLDKAIFVIDETLAGKNECPSVFINPEITEYSDEIDEEEEGCLSIPEQTFIIKRPKKINIKALDETGKKFKFTAKGYLARVLQHETDHLNGVLISDKK